MEERGVPEHMIAVGQRLADTQPYLNGVIERQLQLTATNNDESRKMADMALLIFELLDNQGQADAMRNQFDQL